MEPIVYEESPLADYLKGTRALNDVIDRTGLTERLR